MTNTQDELERAVEEAVALWGCADGNGVDPRLIFRDRATAEQVAAGLGLTVQPLYTHPAPIKPSGDTGELRERVLEAQEWIGEAECRRGCSTWRPDVHGRSRCDCGREDALNAILYLIQSESGKGLAG